MPVFICAPERGLGASCAKTGVAISALTAAAAANNVTFFIVELHIFEGRNRRGFNPSRGVPFPALCGAVSHTREYTLSSAHAV
jgi:hypothetical protein